MRPPRVVVDERGVRPTLLDEAPLETPVVVGVERLLGVHRVEVGAPAAAEHAVVALREPGEPVPGFRAERSADVLAHPLIQSGGHSLVAVAPLSDRSTGTPVPPSARVPVSTAARFSPLVAGDREPLVEGSRLLVEDLDRSLHRNGPEATGAGMVGPVEEQQEE